MSKKPPVTVDDAYALDTPADSTRLYGDWAETYDEDFVAATGYVVHRRIADTLLQHRDQIDGPVLDIGCGTGIVGAVLRENGIEIVDGVDISQAMLDEARKKKTEGGAAVFRNLVIADLTKHVDIPDNQYAGLVSAGTFTHGHLGPEALDEMWRVAKAGAWCAIGVRTTHYVAAGFGEKLADDVSCGTISKPELIEVHLYAHGVGNDDHANDKAFIVVCQVL